MENVLRKVLIEEYRKYPYMEIDDYIKLIYQHVNGGNHLLVDKVEAKKALYEECLNIEADKDVPLYEDIGNNIIRINLKRYKYEKLNVELLFTLFSDSAQIFDKNVMEMEHAFDTLRSLARQGRTPFKITELDNYLKKYRSYDYPLVSHSESYKKHYDPHYRIIHKLYLSDILAKE